MSMSGSITVWNSATGESLPPQAFFERVGLFRAEQCSINHRPAQGLASLAVTQDATPRDCGFEIDTYCRHSGAVQDSY